jgi:hypothetical protein
MCKGIWRKDTEATILATLHRIETASQLLKISNPDFRFTLIVLMGKPYESNKSNKKDAASSSGVNNGEIKHENESQTDKNNDPINSYHVHTNFTLVLQLIEILRKNYPERLSKVLIVPHGWEKILGTHGLRSFVPQNRTRQKIYMLECMDDLTQFVAKDELSVLAGGTLPVAMQ